jgi:hypothetical protein
MEYRNISNGEISILEKQNCRAEDWSDIQVTDSFSTENVQNVFFSGSCRLGNFDGRIRNSSGQEVGCGLYNSGIYNSIIGDNIHISNVQRLSNYHVESDVVIENVNEISLHKESTFGNGLEIDVLNEGGGRELPIFDRLSSQLAYLIVVYRHDEELINILKDRINEYSAEKRSTIGMIQQGSRICNCNTIQDIFIGINVTINGAQFLENGSIIGESNTTTYVGSGVVAVNFIIQSGSSLDSGAVIENTFIGQGVKIGKQFSAENSVFFANSEGFHGEAVSIFAGPYTVTHHKSTLLIAGMFSFFNAGSGTNQSNHMYKLGPLHQGIVERGSKTGSFSYMLWPCKIGPFSVVMGKHSGNFDTSGLPFSYLTVENEKSFLTPAMNLITVGTRRDSVKWRERDRRKGNTKLDLIHFDLYNPFLMDKILIGIDTLMDLYEKTPKEWESVNYNGVRIKRLMLKSCRKYYEMALHIFVGEQVLNRLGTVKDFSSISSIKRLFVNDDHDKRLEWVDMAGLIVSRNVLEVALTKIKQNSPKDLGELEKVFKNLYDSYESYTWKYTLQLLKNRFSVTDKEITAESLQDIVLRWKENSVRLNNMILSDAKKEFDANSMIGFGLGGDEYVRNIDFEKVRGNYEENSFVKGLIEEKASIERTAEDIIRKLKHLKV